MYYLYILVCRGGELYTGITTDLERRLREHAGGARGARYTRAHQPVGYAAAWCAGDRSSALRLERRVKRLGRREKLAVIEGALPLPDDFAGCRRVI